MTRIPGIIKEKKSLVAHVSLKLRHDRRGILRIIQHMNCLESLKMHFLPTVSMRQEGEETFWREVDELLKLGRLRRLKIIVEDSDYATGGLNTAVSNLIDNKTLAFFSLHGFREPYSEEYQRRMVKVLEKNTTLETAEISRHLEYVQENEWQKCIEYYTAMNRHGRGVIIRASGFTDSFMNALACVQHDSDDKGEWAGVTVLYSLLREAPGIWSNPGGGSEEGTKASVHHNKRKATQDPD